MNIEAPHSAAGMPLHEPPRGVNGGTGKKIPPLLRKKKIHPSPGSTWYKHLTLKLREDSQFLRSVIQYAFLLLCVWIGIEFAIFARWGASGGTGIYVSRPPGAEGFLPISALISLKYWIQTGVINDIHPAGLFIFLAIAATGFLLKKAFCGWLCPIGTLSESLWNFGKWLFGRNLAVGRWIDYPLRGIKYLLLLFFAWSIYQMDIPSLKAFIESPYNKVADVKMYFFFAEISTFALWTIIILILLSVVIKNFWCRYLCPYGALLGIASWLSPLKITRNKATCIDCGLCTKACPSMIDVQNTRRVWSDECMNCLACVEVCPVKETLDVRTSFTETRIPNWVFGILVAGVFVAVTGLAMIGGRWQNRLSNEEYLRRFKEINSPKVQHFHGKVPDYGPND